MVQSDDVVPQLPSSWTSMHRCPPVGHQSSPVIPMNIVHSIVSSHCFCMYGQSVRLMRGNQIAFYNVLAMNYCRLKSINNATNQQKKCQK